MVFVDGGAVFWTYLGRKWVWSGYQRAVGFVSFLRKFWRVAMYSYCFFKKVVLIRVFCAIYMLNYSKLGATWPNQGNIASTINFSIFDAMTCKNIRTVIFLVFLQKR